MSLLTKLNTKYTYKCNQCDSEISYIADINTKPKLTTQHPCYWDGKSSSGIPHMAANFVSATPYNLVLDADKEYVFNEVFECTNCCHRMEIPTTEKLIDFKPEMCLYHKCRCGIGRFKMIDVYFCLNNNKKE